MDLEKMSYRDLQKLARKYGLPTRGKKTDLIARIREYQEKTAEPVDKKTALMEGIYRRFPTKGYKKDENWGPFWSAWKKAGLSLEELNEFLRTKQ